MVEGKVISIGNVAYVLGMAVKKLHRWYQNVLSGFKQAEEQGHIGKDDLEVYEDGQYTDIAVPIVAPNTWAVKWELMRKRLTASATLY